VHILDERWRRTTDRERALLERLAGFLEDFGSPSEDVSLVRRKLTDLEELFLLVIVGEFNSGKSAFINALLGDELSQEGVTPTTDRITVLRYSEEASERERREGVLERASERLSARDSHRRHAGDERDHSSPRGA
jgi:GTP1/Obg family GTP-binding protein